jgi:hypothetical protein
VVEDGDFAERMPLQMLRSLRVALENVERHLFELGEVFLREQHLDGAHISRGVEAPEHKFGHELPLPSSCHCGQAAYF